MKKLFLKIGPRKFIVKSKIEMNKIFIKKHKFIVGENTKTRNEFIETWEFYRNKFKKGKTKEILSKDDFLKLSSEPPKNKEFTSVLVSVEGVKKYEGVVYSLYISS